MKSFFNKILICLIAFGMIFLVGNFFAQNADAATKKKSKAGLSQEQLDTMSQNLNTLTRKIYANSLFSPKDNETMINVKLDLDDAMLKTPSSEYAPLYYMEANLLKKRGYKNEAIECYQTIIENFADTAFAPKAKQELTKMGVKIALPEADSNREEE